MNKKNVIIIVSLAFAAGLGLLIYWFFTTNQNTQKSSSLQEIIIGSKYASTNELTSCQQGETSKECLSELYERAYNGISLQLGFIDRSDDSNVNKYLDGAKKAASESDWTIASRDISAAINASDDLIAAYIADTRSEAKVIHDLLIPNTTTNISNYYIRNEWAVVSLSSADSDPANILLKKAENQWTVLVGPGTSFEQGTATNLGAPNSIEAHMQTIYDAVILNYTGLTSTVNNETLDSAINAAEGRDITSLPLFDKLPVDTDSYGITADYIGNKPCYTITIYYTNNSDKNSHKEKALAWFTDQSIKTSEIPIRFEYLQNSTDE